MKIRLTHPEFWKKALSKISVNFRYVNLSTNIALLFTFDDEIYKLKRSQNEVK